MQALISLVNFTSLPPSLTPPSRTPSFTPPTFTHKVQHRSSTISSPGGTQSLTPRSACFNLPHLIHLPSRSLACCTGCAPRLDGSN
mmetsp:Transcript_28793/g.57957  ORF Transcript_28793/g.57957 Transcript_28793/m.57957 type:complete len:86 (-) Transcript_28793:138-395(-)